MSRLSRLALELAAVGLALCWMPAGAARAESPVETGTQVVAPAAEPPAAQAKPEPGSFWAWLWDYLYVGAGVTVGLGTRQADIQVRDKITNAYGKISERNENAYFLSYSTRPSFIGTSKFGYNFAFNYTRFTMDRQEVAKDDYRDIGTRVRGRVAYVVPTLFYQLGEHGPKGAYARLGVGLGLGVAKYEGNIILDYPSNTTPVEISNGRYDLKTAASLYLEGRYRNWGVTVTAAGPVYEDDRYRYNVTDISAYLNYKYYF